jgi:hypothetical protein
MLSSVNTGHMTSKHEIFYKGNNCRRADHVTAERIHVAELTAHAFNVHRATNYLLILGISAVLIEQFVARFPSNLRKAPL